MKNKIVHYVRGKDIIFFTLTLNKFYRILTCYSIKGTGDVVELTYKKVMNL